MLALVVCVAAWASACSTTGFRAPVTQFSEASLLVIETSRAYIVQVNRVERDAYVDGKVAARRPIRPDELQAQALLTPDEIALRMAALDQLARYGSLLVKLANGDAPDSIAGQARNLGNSVEKLSTDVAAAAGRPENAAFKSAMGPVTSVISQVARLAVERKTQQALDTAIREGEVPVKNLIALLAEETGLAYERKRSYLSRARTRAVDAYNQEAAKGAQASGQALATFGGQVKLSYDEWDAFTAARPQDGFAAMTEAHEALLTYAKSPKTPKSLGEFVSEMEQFLSTARKVSAAARTSGAAPP